MRFKRRIVTGLSFLFAVAVVLVAAIALRPWMTEQWLIWKLESEEGSEWRRAASDLLERRCLRAIPHIARAALREDAPGFPEWHSRITTRFGRSSVRMLPALREGLRGDLAGSDLAGSDRVEVRRAVLLALRDIRNKFPEIVPLLVEALESDDRTTRWQAAHVLGVVGPGAVARLPKLIDTLADADERVRWAAAVALGCMAPASDSGEAIPPLIRALGDRSSLVAKFAAMALVSYGPRARAAVPRLIEMLRAKDPTLRFAAAEALGAIGADAGEAVPFLLRALEEIGDAAAPPPQQSWIDSSKDFPRKIDRLIRSRDPGGGRRLAQALGEIRQDAERAVPALSRLLDSRDSYLRRVATRALGSFGPAAAVAVPALVEGLECAEHRNHELFHSDALDPGTVWTLARIGLPAIPHLKRALKHRDERVRRGAASALGYMGPRARAALPELRRCLEDVEVPVRAIAALAIHRIDARADVLPFLLDARRGQVPDGIAAEMRPLAARSVPSLIEALRSGGDRAEIAARLLGELGEEGVEAVRPLLEALRDGSLELRLEAAWALGSFPSRAERIVPELLKVLQDDDVTAVRIRVLWCLARFGRPAPRAVPFLLQMLGEEMRPDLRVLVFSALASVGAGDPEVVKILMERLERARFFWQAREILRAILRMEPPANEAVPALRRTLSHEDGLVRVLAARSLLRITGDAESVLPVLRAGLRDNTSWRAPPVLRAGRRGNTSWRAPPRDFSANLVGVPDVAPFFLCRRPENLVRRQAARSAAEAGAAARPLLPELLDGLGSSDRWLRVLAAGAVWKIAGRAEVEVVTSVLRRLSTDRPVLARASGWDHSLEEEALHVLGEMGPAAARAVPFLEELRSTALSATLRIAVAEALESVRGT